MTLSERIKRTAAQKGLSIKQLEQLAGLSNGQIGKWSTQNSTFDRIAEVAKYLNVSIDWLITGKEPGELSAEEKELVEHYRNANETSKLIIMSAAQVADTTQKEDKAQISTSAVG